MGSQQGFKVKLLVSLVLGSLLVIGSEVASADNETNLGTVQTSASGTAYTTSTKKKASAPYQAPTQGSLKATEPISVINQHYIQENASAGSNYSDIVNVSPSIVSVDPNGPGLMETQSLSMRGFQDGEYNVTFDGIPWGDSNDFTHHSTSYFMPQDLGGIVVDRGPGDASTLGDATFGGTINVFSKKPGAEPMLTPYIDIGSFNTQLQGLQFDSGVMKNYGDASMFLDYKNLTSDGYLNYGHQRRQNVVAKILKPIGNDTVLTLFTMYQHLNQNIPYAATLNDIQKYGKQYDGLNNDPTTQGNSGYNYDNINTDFDYIGLQSVQGDWKIDEKLYTYGYYHHGFNGLNPFDPASANTADANGEFNPTTPWPTYANGDGHVPGQKMYMLYRGIGNVLRLSHPLGQGEIDIGAWYEHQGNNRAEWATDYTTGGIFTNTSGSYTNGYDRLMHDSLVTFEPYVQYTWKPTNRLKVTPGVRYVSFKRKLNATVDQKTGGQPLNYSKNWTKLLPSINAHYAISQNWTAYAQVAKGFLAPNLNLFYTTVPSLTDIKPQETTNYQLGTTWESHRLTLSGDIYYIDFNNKIGKRATSASSPTPGVTYYVNEGGAKYQGIEGEATYYLGRGVSLYGNFSINSAKEKGSHNWVPYTPDHTLAAGVIYNRGPFYASLIAKNIGKQYASDSAGVNGDANGAAISSYTVANLATSYTVKGTGWYKMAKVGFQINNLFNNRNVYWNDGTTLADSTAIDPAGAGVWTIPERSYMFTVKVGM